MGGRIFCRNGIIQKLYSTLSLETTPLKNTYSKPFFLYGLDHLSFMHSLLSKQQMRQNLGHIPMKFVITKSTIFIQ